MSTFLVRKGVLETGLKNKEYWGYWIIQIPKGNNQNVA